MCCTYRKRRRDTLGWRRVLLTILAAVAIGVLLLVGTSYQRSQAPQQKGAAAPAAIQAANHLSIGITATG